MSTKPVVAVVVSGVLCVGLSFRSGGGAPLPAQDEPAGEFVAAHVAVVGLGRNLLTERGVPMDSLGRHGLADDAASAIAALVEARETSGISVLASFATVLPVGRKRSFTRGVEFPTSTVASGEGSPLVGFGGYIAARNALEIEARPSVGGAFWVDVGYVIEQPESLDAAPPVKSSMSGSYAVRLRKGELGVAGGRLGSETESGFVFVVVRLAAE